MTAKQKKIARPLGISLALILLLFLFLYPHLRNFFQEKKKQNVIMPVELCRAEFGSLEKKLKVQGYIESESVVTVLPRVSGVLEMIKVDIGDKVKAGDLIARIDSTPYDLELQQAYTAFQSVESAYLRMQRIYQQKGISMQDYEQAKARFETSRAQYALAKLQVSYTSLRSPIDGVVLIRHISPGNMAAPSQPVLTIGNPNSLLVRARVPDRYFPFFKDAENQDVEIYSRIFPGKTYRAKIKAVSPYVSSESHTFEALCRVQENTEDLKPGMQIELDFVLEKKNDVYFIPRQCLTKSGKIWSLDQNSNKAKSYPVKNSFANDDFLVIDKSLKDLLFIKAGQDFLEEGQKVNPLNFKDKAQ